MGFKCGFDIYPRLEPTPEDQEAYRKFVSHVVRDYFQHQGSGAGPAAAASEGTTRITLEALPGPAPVHRVWSDAHLYYRFRLGIGSPRIPADPQHCTYFLRFAMEVSEPGVSRSAERCIHEVYHIAKIYFPGRVKYFHQCDERSRHTRDGYYSEEEVEAAEDDLCDVAGVPRSVIRS